ncbi:MAG: hypothetical protein R6W77_16870 [Trueperaceae bacterium]
MNAVTWVDAVLVVLVAVLTALGAKKQWVGLVVGLGGLVLLRPLLVIGSQDPWIAIAAGFLGGILLGVLARRLSVTGRGTARPETVLGGIGGLALGMMLMASLVTSLPIQRNPANEREIFYPPRDAPTSLAQVFQRSPLVTAGRGILLYPLLDTATTMSDAEARLYGGLHALLVVGEPWTRR